MSPGGKLGRKSERAVPPASGGAVVTRSTVDLIPHVRPRARKWLRPEWRCTWGRGRRTCGLHQPGPAASSPSPPPAFRNAALGCLTCGTYAGARRSRPVACRVRSKLSPQAPDAVSRRPQI